MKVIAMLSLRMPDARRGVAQKKLSAFGSQLSTFVFLCDLREYLRVLCG
jgi:hypothetical protein